MQCFELHVVQRLQIKREDFTPKEKVLKFPERKHIAGKLNYTRCRRSLCKDSVIQVITFALLFSFVYYQWYVNKYKNKFEVMERICKHFIALAANVFRYLVCQ
jgi:hypothetical protein